MAPEQPPQLMATLNLYVCVIVRVVKLWEVVGGSYWQMSEVRLVYIGITSGWT
jgi:hypothetical protein